MKSSKLIGATEIDRKTVGNIGQKIDRKMLRKIDGKM